MNTPTQQRNRAPLIGVIGSGHPGPYDQLAHELGQLLAQAGYVVLTGGGSGIMGAASQGAAEAGGLVVGILPSDSPHDPRYSGRFPNPYVHIPIFTGLSDARNVINIKSSDVVVALPGRAGTLSEVALALKNGKHVVVLNWPELILPPNCSPDLIHYITDASSAVRLVAEFLSVSSM